MSSSTAPLPHVSVQLYSLAKEFGADMHGSLERLASIGFEYVEAFDFVARPREFRGALDAAGLASPTGHAPLLSDALWTPDGSITTPEPHVVFDAAARIGIQTVIDPFVAPDRWLTQEGVQDIADRMNALVGVAEEFGLTVGYHNHAQEFVADFSGESAYERFVALTDDRVQLELDLFWAQTGGQDVPALVKRLGARLTAVHVKDGVVPAENPWGPGAHLSGSTSLDQRRAGKGAVPLTESMAAGSAIAYAIVEYDNPPGDVFDDVAASREYLLVEGLAS